MKKTTIAMMLLAILSAGASLAATPVAGPHAAFLVDPVTGSVLRCEGGTLAVSRTGGLAQFTTLAQESTDLVAPRDAKNGTIEVLTGQFADENDVGNPVIRSSSGQVLLAGGMSAAVDRVLTAESKLSWDGAAVWQTTYTPNPAPFGDGPQPAERGTFTYVSIRIADQRTFEQTLVHGMGGVEALGFDDILIALNTGGILRTKAGRLLWKLDSMPGGSWCIQDVDLKKSAVLVIDEDGGLAAVDLNGGSLLWRWHAPSSAAPVRAFLLQTRTQATMDANRGRALEEARELEAEGWIEQGGSADQVLRTEYGIVGARFTPDGRVLVVGNTLAPWAAIFDPASQALAGRELIDALALARHAVAAAEFRVHSVGLGSDFVILPASLDETPGLTLLFKSPEGWFTTPLSALN
jgi:hypothetical protein